LGFLAVALLLLTTSDGSAHARGPSPHAQRQQAIASVKSWGYQLQRLVPDAIKASPFDLIVIDHAPDRVESVELMFRHADVAALKTKPDGSRRIVLAYLSIGEAERYRFYWNEAWHEPSSRPSWLGPDNPQWIGNYPVEYWQAEWKAIIFGRTDSYIDRLLEAGFDGLYLDRADVYEQFKSRSTAKADMEQFIADLTDYARTINPQAIIVLQNAEELVRTKSVRNRIDAIAKESLYYNPDQTGVVTSVAEQEASLQDLRRARKAGRKVLLVEYVSDPDRARDARRKANEEGFVIHFAERSLSLLNDNAPDQPPKTVEDLSSAPAVPAQ
jgi:cysteinyl-tRNA synthetase